MEKAERLTQTRIFHDFGEEEIKRVASIAMEKIYPAGKDIISEGTVGEGLFVIIEGEVNVNKCLPESEEIETLAILGPGDHFGEMALIDGRIASATIVAMQSTVCFVLKRDDYYDMIAKEPIIAMKLYRFYTKTLCERLRRTDSFLLKELVRNKNKIEPGILDGST